MNFQKLLGNKEYELIRRTETYLYVRIAFNHFVFYNENNELKCFHIESFEPISVLKFFELNYSMSNQEIISLENSSLTVKLTFEQEPLTTILGKCFKLKNIQNVDPSNIINEESLRFVEDFASIIPSIKWKFSIPDQFYYFIPSTKFCIKFNSNTFFQFGHTNYRLTHGEQNHLYFLNPYTIFEYYSDKFPDDKNSIYVGKPVSLENKVNMIIRGTNKELLRAFQIFCELHSLPFTIDYDKIRLHLVGHNFPQFFNTYKPILFDALMADYSFFQDKTSFTVDYSNSIDIRPHTSNNTTYTLVEFVNDSSRLQIIIEFLLNKLYPASTNINIITYSPLPVFDYEQADFEEIPTDVIMGGDY